MSTGPDHSRPVQASANHARVADDDDQLIGSEANVAELCFGRAVVGHGEAAADERGPAAAQQPHPGMFALLVGLCLDLHVLPPTPPHPTPPHPRCHTALKVPRWCKQPKDTHAHTQHTTHGISAALQLRRARGVANGHAQEDKDCEAGVEEVPRDQQPA